MITRYILRWTYGDVPLHSWYIRTISPDGYFGEVTIRNSPDNRIITVKGDIKQDDYRKIDETAKFLESFHQHEINGEVRGVLGSGTPSDCKIVYRYYDRKENDEAALRFIEIVEIMRPYLESQYLST